MTGDIQGFTLPPDKSILHRLLVIGSLTEATIDVPLQSADLPLDIEATIGCLQSLGVRIDRTPLGLRIYGSGLNGWRTPQAPLNCGNSGTTARLLTGALCAQPITVTLTGDESLSRRPMKRLANLLNEHFGADVSVSTNDGLPLTIKGKALQPSDVRTPAASAQLKSALLLAALHTPGTSTITEPSVSRDHTEVMLQAFGVELSCENNKITIHSKRAIPLAGSSTYIVPLDISAAYYLIVAAILNGKSIRLENVLLNPTRTRFLSLLSETFANIELTDQRTEWGELRGSIIVQPTQVKAASFTIGGEDIPQLIDELPLLAVLAAFLDGKLIVKDAGELRFKESDRIALVVKNLQSFGVGASETATGFEVSGQKGFKPKSAEIEHRGDHRIAMAFALMAGHGESVVTISDPSVVSVSYPGYFTDLAKIIGREHIQFV